MSLLRSLLITTAASVLVLAVLALIPILVPVADDFRAPGAPGANLPVVLLHRGVEARQEFRASGKAIETVSVELRGDKRTTRSTVHMEIERQTPGGGWERIGKTSTAKVRRSGRIRRRFKLKRPIKVVPGELLSLKVSADGSPAQAVGWVVNPSWNAAPLRFRVNGVDQMGIAQFRIYYKRLSGPVASVFPQLWKRLTVFSHFFARTLLACGFGLALIGFVHATLWPPKDEDEPD